MYFIDKKPFFNNWKWNQLNYLLRVLFKGSIIFVSFLRRQESSIFNVFFLVKSFSEFQLALE